MKQLLILIFGITLISCTKDTPLIETNDHYEVNVRGLANGKVKAPAKFNEVVILDSNSDFENHIYLVSPGPDLFIGIDDDILAPPVALPEVKKGKELIFEIRVHDPNDGTLLYTWKSGPPSRNPDHRRHVSLSNLPGNAIQVNFEDIPASDWGVADEPNFVDAIFVVRPL